MMTEAYQIKMGLYQGLNTNKKAIGIDWKGVRMNEIATALLEISKSINNIALTALVFGCIWLYKTN